MSRSPAPEIVRRALLRHGFAGASDATLLVRYTRHQDHAAFAELVERYAPLVWGACRRACADSHAAEDAFQATFIALARRAGAIRRVECLPAWLHGVARRVAWRSRRAKPTETIPDRSSSGPSPVEQASAGELLTAVEEEVARLPEKYRSALLLCWFEDGSLDDAARRLGVSKGVLWGRLKRGRDRLRRRLAARGFGPAVLVAAVTLTGSPAAAGLVSRTIESALQAPAHSPAIAFGALAWFKMSVVAAVGAAVVGAITMLPTGAPEPPKDAPKKEPLAEVPFDDGFPLPPGALHRFGNRQMRHPEGVIAAVVSPDGRLLATASSWAVIVWDLKTLSAKRVLTGARFHTYGLVGQGTNLAFLPDSKSLLVGLRPPEQDGKVALGGTVPVAQAWDLDTGKVRYTLSGPMSYYNALWLRAGGKEIVRLGDELAVVFYDASDGKELRRLPTAQQLTRPWVSGDGETFAHSPGQDRGIVVVRTKDGQELFRVPGGTVEGAALNHDGRVLVYQDVQKKVRARDLKADKDLAEFTHPGERINAPMRLSADGKTLYFGSEQGHLYRWDLTTNKAIPGLGRHSLWTLTSLAVSPDESTLFTMGHNKAIRRWDLKTAKELPLPVGYQTQAFFELSADGKRLFIGDHATQLDEWDLTTGKKVRVLSPEGNGGVNAVATSPDGKWLVTGRVVQDVQLWDLTTGKMVKELLPADKPDRSGGDQVSRVAFSPDSKVVYGMSPKTGLTAWEVPTGKKRWNVSSKVPLLAVDPRGQFLIMAGSYDNPPAPWMVLDAKTGEVVARVEPPTEVQDPRMARRVFAPYTTGLTFTADGRWVVSGHYDGSVRLWEAGSWRPVRKLTVGDQSPVHVAVSADGKWVGVGANEARVSVWELATGKVVRRFDGHQSWVTQVAFTKDGQGLLSNADLAPILWDLAPKDLPTDGLWEALASDDAAKAYRAQWALIRDPKAAVTLLSEQMKPADLAVSREQFDKWVTGLDSPQFRVREASEKALIASGAKVPVGWLRKALLDSRADEPRARLTRVLAQREKEPDPIAWRVSRAVQALELMGTAESKGLLKKWSEAAGTPLVDEASEALSRILATRSGK